MSVPAPIRLHVLPPSQRRLWAELCGVPSHFVLYGGTALALRLGHRESEDFDFFSSRPFVPSRLANEIAFLRGAETLQSAENWLVMSVDRDGPVKVSFFGGLPLKRVRAPDLISPPGVRLASLLDVAAAKVKVILDRALAKDYVDIAALLDAGLSLSEMLGAARTVYGPSYNPLLALKALCYYGEPSLQGLPERIRKRLTEATARVRLETLSEVPAESSHIGDP